MCHSPLLLLGFNQVAKGQREMSYWKMKTFRNARGDTHCTSNAVFDCLFPTPAAPVCRAQESLFLTMNLIFILEILRNKLLSQRWCDLLNSASYNLYKDKCFGETRKKAVKTILGFELAKLKCAWVPGRWSESVETPVCLKLVFQV